MTCGFKVHACRMWVIDYTLIEFLLGLGEALRSFDQLSCQAIYPDLDLLLQKESATELKCEPPDLE